MDPLFFFIALKEKISKMTLKQKIASAQITSEEKIVLNYEDGAGVIHAYDDYVAGVMEKTGISQVVADLITNPLFKNEAIEDLRMNCYLEDYPRDHSGFANFVAGVISENVYDMDFLERHTERYDYKRGQLTIRASIVTTAGAILNAPEHLFIGWSATISTSLGSLKVEG